MTSMAERAEETGIPVHLLDLENDERLGDDPFAVWDEATSVAPLFYSPAGRGFFVAADYDTVKAVLQNPRMWSNLPSPITYTKEEVVIDVPPITMDPPQHTAYRRALIPLFSPNVVTTLEPRVRELSHELCDAIEAQGGCDFAKDFAGKLPARFFLEWLGVTRGDADRMFKLAQAATFDFPTQEERDAIEEEINKVVSDVITARREEPADDLATAFTQIRIDGEPVEEKLLVGMATLAFIAGQETTSTQLSYIAWHLARHPADRDLLVGNPDLLPDAVEELMRVYNTGGPSGRVATQDGELAGCPIKKGDRVFIARSGADRQLDGEVQLLRKPNRHSAFGLGVHRCLGSHVARMEMRIGLEVWHERFPKYRLAPDFVAKHRYGSFMQQLTTLPLDLNPA
ncbi:cytochrome P450 [Prauserella cavernicola]|uniref:Cytochrome P450 n=1 Tax=Prauserella cavernicola TaxID=2800127 RepID=A0A934QXI4_9PSEU|nr:cytochrome P450 [Prauserella cavernicola]MBK1787109.1 cytochrome P450 [Prauserella cavernicola]